MQSLNAIFDFVRDSLGRGSVEVELTDAQILAGVKHAVTLINSYSPVKRWIMLPSVTAGRLIFPKKPVDSGLVNTPGLINVPGVMSVSMIESIRNRRDGVPYDFDSFDPLVYAAGGLSSSGGLALYNDRLNYIQESRKRLSATPEFRTQVEYDEVLGQPVLALYFATPKLYSYEYAIEVYMEITPDDDERTGLLYMTPGIESWFHEYVLAAAQYTLGRILGKHAGIDGPDGNVLPLDNNELRGEGAKELERLRDEIANRNRTFAPLIG